jgi:leucyl aminopeptidase
VGTLYVGFEDGLNAGAFIASDGWLTVGNGASLTATTVFIGAPAGSGDKGGHGHLDIAGTAWYDSVRPHQAKGPTGVAVRTLLRLVESSQ